MTVLFSCSKVKKEFGETTILKDINFEVVEGDRVAVVGINGAGKTTMANIIYGTLGMDGGSILWYKKDIEIGYLHQQGNYSHKTFQDTKKDNFSNKGEDINFKEDFYQISSELGMEKVSQWEEERLSNLSGGEKMKIALANIWALNPDFLILDEPTNHLDYGGVQWLIQELKKYRGTILIISHDRYFLNESVNKIIEVKDGKAEIYKGNYSFYREEKQRRYESQLHQYQIQESMKEAIRGEIDRLGNWSDKAHRDSRKKEQLGIGKKEYFRKKAKKKDKQIKSKIKRLEKIDVTGIDKPKEDKKINFGFEAASLKGRRIIEGKSMEKAYGNRQLFSHSSFYVKRGEKVGIFGDNGCGKTTFLKILLGDETLDKGEIFISSSVGKGYLSQETLDVDKSMKVIDLFNFISREEQGKIRTLLANMGFDEKMINKPVGTLSLGELTRVRMTKLILNNEELLILDEPLNHLDIYSREKLEEALLDYNGTILVVSHDRYMLQNLCDVLLVFKENKIIRVNGSAKEYLEGLDKATQGNSEVKENKISKENQEENILKERKIKEEKLIIENEIAFVLGEFSKYAFGSKEYEELDKKFKKLIEQRKRFS